MFVTFHTDAWASITMFAATAQTMLRLLGHSGTVPGALLAADVPLALERLRQELAVRGNDPAPSPARRADEDEDKAPPPIVLRQRAQPLLQLLEAAADKKKAVSWKADAPRV